MIGTATGGIPNFDGGVLTTRGDKLPGRRPGERIDHIGLLMRHTAIGIRVAPDARSFVFAARSKKLGIVGRPLYRCYLVAMLVVNE